MRFMVIVKGSGNCEASTKPGEKFPDEVRKFNDALANAGVLIAVERLHHVSEGVRVAFSGGKRTVIDGPFPETKELVGGFWLWKVKSKEEALEWARRCPLPNGGEVELEIREVFEPGDFGPALRREAAEWTQREPTHAGGK
jgi:hypothetical protein